MPLDLAAQLVEELAPRLLVEVLVGEQLEEAAEREDRRAQLVRRGGDELLARAVEPRELVLHVVERGRELAELVVGVGADRVREVARRHLARRLLEPADALRQRARHEVAGEQRDHQRDRRRRAGSGGGSARRCPRPRRACRRTPRRRRPPCCWISGYATIGVAAGRRSLGRRRPAGACAAASSASERDLVVVEAAVGRRVHLADRAPAARSSWSRISTSALAPAAALVDDACAQRPLGAWRYVPPRSRQSPSTLLRASSSSRSSFWLRSRSCSRGVTVR